MVVLNRGEINSIAVHPSGKLCFSVARDRTLRMWNLVKGRIAFIRRLEKEAELVMISQKGTHYALGFGKDLSVFNMNAEVGGRVKTTMASCRWLKLTIVFCSSIAGGHAGALQEDPLRRVRDRRIHCVRWR